MALALQYSLEYQKSDLRHKRRLLTDPTAPHYDLPKLKPIEAKSPSFVKMLNGSLEPTLGIMSITLS